MSECGRQNYVASLVPSLLCLEAAIRGTIFKATPREIRCHSDLGTPVFWVPPYGICLLHSS